MIKITIEILTDECNKESLSKLSDKEQKTKDRIIEVANSFKVNNHELRRVLSKILNGIRRY